MHSTELSYHPSGAIHICAGSLTLMNCLLQQNRAQMGAGIRVSGGAVSVVRSRFVSNSAAVGGGALHVSGGAVELANGTLFLENSCPPGQGSSILLMDTGAPTLRYTLPTPAGRWALAPRGLVSEISPGAIDGDFPYACAAGVLGGSAPEQMQGPQCNGPCPEGHYCPSTELVPHLCEEGSFCPLGSALPQNCKKGRYSNASGVSAASQCQLCIQGFSCTSGAPYPKSCKSGTFSGLGASTCKKYLRTSPLQPISTPTHPHPYANPSPSLLQRIPIPTPAHL